MRFLQIAQGFENGGPQRGIHHRHRFIGNQQARFEQKRTRHIDALPLAAGKLMGEAPQNVLWA